MRRHLFCQLTSLLNQTHDFFLLFPLLLLLLLCLLFNKILLTFRLTKTMQSCGTTWATLWRTRTVTPGRCSTSSRPPGSSQVSRLIFNSVPPEMQEIESWLVPHRPEVISSTFLFPLVLFSCYFSFMFWGCVCGGGFTCWAISKQEHPYEKWHGWHEILQQAPDRRRLMRYDWDGIWKWWSPYLQ